MAPAPNRSRAKRPPFSTLADQLYPAGDPRQSETDVPDADAGDEQYDAAGESPAQPMSQKEMADKVYPEDAEGEDEPEDAADSQDDEGSEDGEGAEDNDGQENQGAIGRMHAVMRMYGMNLKPKDGSNEAAQLAKTEDGLRKKIAVEEEKKGSALTPDEEMNITLGYVANNQVEMLLADSGSARSNAFNERHHKLNDLTPELSPFVKEVLLRMEIKGWHPKIQQAKRTQEEEVGHMKDGTSSLRDPKRSKHYDLGAGADAVDITDSRYGWGAKKGTENQAKAFFKDLGESLEETKSRWGESGDRFQWGGYWHKPYDPAHIENTERIAPSDQDSE